MKASGGLQSSLSSSSPPLSQSSSYHVYKSSDGGVRWRLPRPTCPLPCLQPSVTWGGQCVGERGGDNREWKLAGNHCSYWIWNQASIDINLIIVFPFGPLNYQTEKFVDSNNFRSWTMDMKNWKRKEWYETIVGNRLQNSWTPTTVAGQKSSKENSSQTGIIYHTTQLDREEKVDLNKEREGESTERASIGNFLMWWPEPTY